jgi:hypothetical protein
LKQLYKQIGSWQANTLPFELIETDEQLKEIIQKMLNACDAFLSNTSSEHP